MLRSNTCLGVVEHNGKLYFAGDRRISWGMHKAQKGVRPKVTFRDGILYAGTGTSAMCDEITDLFKSPKKGKLNPYDYIHTKFMPALLKHLIAQGYVRKDERNLKQDKDGDSVLSATILVGIDTSLFELDVGSDAIIIDSISAPYAAGCGGMYALGALLAMADNQDPVDKLTKALQIAASISPGCDTHIDIVHN